eukprot:4255322-Amphidinium_carterae.1
MGDHDARQAALLNQTMDEFSSSMNSCISQLTIELERAESETGTVVSRLRTAMEKKHSLRLPSDEVQCLCAEKQRLESLNELLTKEGELMKQQMMACQTAVQNIRNEACLFSDKMIVDAKTLCQYHVDTVKDIQGKCQGEINQEQARLHKEAQKHQEQLEQELTEYQKSLDKQAEKAVRERHQQEMDKVKAEMNSAVQAATGSREKLEQHYKKELADASKIIQEERVARQQLERTLETTSMGAATMSRQLEAVKEKYDRELTERACECGHMKEHCEALETQLRSIARALTMKGTLSRSDIEWHDGRHDLFDQLMDDCAGEMAEFGDMADENLEGSVTALPGEPGTGISHLSLLMG